MEAEYEFLFVVEGVSALSDGDVSVLAEGFDGLLVSHREQQLLAVSGAGCDAVDGAHRLVVRLRRALPGLRLLRLDADLVGVPDIAERTGRSRQNVLQWVRGERRADPTPFPASEGTVGRSLIWRWGEVNAWLARFGEGDETRVPSREEALAIDVLLSLWQRAMDEGTPLVKVLVPQDEHARERADVARSLEEALHHSPMREVISALPRTDPTRLLVACAVLRDKLRSVLAQFVSDDVSGLLAVRVADGGLRLLGVASRALPGTRPIAELGLGPDATVGDLLLELNHTEHASRTPLALA